MLSIFVRKEFPAEHLTDEIVWKQGDPWPPFYLGESLRLHNIVSVIATGSELHAITDRFRSLPYNRFNSEMIWEGEFARFIAHNL